MGILGYLLYDLKRVEQSLILTTFSQQEREVSEKLNAFFQPVDELLRMGIYTGLYGNFKLPDLHTFNRTFVPLLEVSQSVTSIMLANLQGEEAMVLCHRDTFYNRLTVWSGDSLKSTFYKRGKADSSLQSRPDLSREQRYDPRIRPWFTGALEMPAHQVHWTQPYEFFTTHDLGITASSWWKNPAGETNLLAYDLMLGDICAYTTRLKVQEHGRVFLLTSDGRMIGFPGDPYYASRESVKTDLLKPLNELPVELYRRIGEIWKEQRLSDRQFEFPLNGDEWVCSIRPYRLGNLTFYIGVVAFKSDFHAQLRRTRLLMLGGQLFILLFMLYMIRGYRQKRQSNILLRKRKNLLERITAEVRKQHDMIEVSHRHTMDSIRYAKRIQRAIFSPRELKKDIFPNSFILLKPKDMVSGDFYWFAESNGKKLVAAVDCTGHGVPGALMSVLGHSFLEEIVIKEQEIMPARILDKMREKIIAMLKQSEENKQHDGMDMAILVFEQDMKRVVYAGARNPLYLVRDGALTVYKADSTGVGFEYKPLKLYTDHVIDLQPGDTLYIFSDGFADQFGGPDDRKYMYYRFRELLLSIRHLSMPQQEERLRQEFDDWKGQRSQLDDVCIIGIRV